MTKKLSQLKLQKKKKKYCTQMTSKNTDLSTNKWHGQLYTHTMQYTWFLTMVLNIIIQINPSNDIEMGQTL